MVIHSRRLAGARLALVGDRSDAVAFDHAIRAAGQRQAARPHGLDLAIAHAGEIGADHIAGGLEHAFFVASVLARSAAATATCVRIDRDRRVHAADLDADSAMAARRVGGAGSSRWALGSASASDAGMKMEKMHVNRPGDRAGVCIPANHSVMGCRPDRYAAPVPPTVIEKGDDALVVQRASVLARQEGVISLKGCAAHLERGCRQRSEIG